MTNIVCWKLVKTTIKSDRFPWLKSADKNLKSHPKKIWKYILQFGKKNTELRHFDIDSIFYKLRDISEAFSKYFESAYSSLCSGTFSSISQYM